MQHESTDLGDLVEVYRPLPLWLGWVIILTVPAVVGLFAGLMPPGPLIGLLVFLVMSAVLVVALAGNFVLEHRFYRHAVLFRTLLPFTKSYVVPYDTIDTSTIRQLGWSTHTSPQIHDRPSNRFRECWGQRNIAFVAVDEHSAHQLARSGPSTGRPSLVREWWTLSTRKPEHHIDLLHRLITERDGTTTSS